MKYIGQTSVPLKKRCKEHENWCRKKHKKKLLKSTTKNDGIAYHHHLSGHEIDFENTRILAEETSYWPGLIIEGCQETAADCKGKHVSRIRERSHLGHIFGFFEVLIAIVFD